MSTAGDGAKESAAHEALRRLLGRGLLSLGKVDILLGKKNRGKKKEKDSEL